MSIENFPDIADYHLTILPGRCPPGFRHTEFHNQVFAFWRECWAAVFAENGAASLPDANIFYRQDVVAVITRGERIVGTLFCTENNIASDVTCGISYFARPFITELCRELRGRGISSVATYEMLTVSPQFRKKETGISFGTVLLGLIVNAFRGFDAEVMIGPVRLDNGVQKMTAEFGWELVSPEYSMHGTPVAVSALYREKAREGASALHQTIIRRLWSSRTDLRIETAREERRAA